MSGIIGHLGSKSGVVGKAFSPATLGYSNTYPQFKIGKGGVDQSMLIGMAKGDLMPNTPLIGIAKIFDCATGSGTGIDPANASNAYYGAFYIIVGDRGAGRFIDVVIGGLTAVSTLHQLTVKEDSGGDLDSRTYSMGSQLKVVMGGHSGEYNVSVFQYLGYPTAS